MRVKAEVTSQSFCGDGRIYIAQVDLGAGKEMPVIASQSTNTGADTTKILSIKILKFKWPQLTQKGCRLSG